MALNSDDKTRIQSIWEHIACKSDVYGGEALYRMFSCHPKTKTYFPNFEFKPDSCQIKTHGRKVVDALTNVVHHMDNIDAALDKLSDLHAYDLRVDPGNFPLLAHHFLVTVAVHLHKQFDCLTHQALDKFLANVGCALTSKYR